MGEFHCMMRRAVRLLAGTQRLGTTHVFNTASLRSPYRVAVSIARRSLSKKAGNDLQSDPHADTGLGGVHGDEGALAEFPEDFDEFKSDLEDIVPVLPPDEFTS